MAFEGANKWHQYPILEQWVKQIDGIIALRVYHLVLWQPFCEVAREITCTLRGGFEEKGEAIEFERRHTYGQHFFFFPALCFVLGCLISPGHHHFVCSKSLCTLTFLDTPIRSSADPESSISISILLRVL